MYTLHTAPSELILVLPPQFFLPPRTQFHPVPRRCRPITCCAAGGAHRDIDMTRNKEGIWSAKPKKVVILWDLDNKPPKGPPYEAAMALRQVGQYFGQVVDMSAYANRHAFIHLPQWVRDQRSQRRQVDILERKGKMFGIWRDCSYKGFIEQAASSYAFNGSSKHSEVSQLIL